MLAGDGATIRQDPLFSCATNVTQTPIAVQRTALFKSIFSISVVDCDYHVHLHMRRRVHNSIKNNLKVCSSNRRGLQPLNGHSLARRKTREECWSPRAAAHWARWCAEPREVLLAQPEKLLLACNGNGQCVLPVDYGWSRNI